MTRKTVMRCTASILIILLMILTTISAFAVEKFDREKFSDPQKFRIEVAGIEKNWYGSILEGDTFGQLSVRYVIDNMDGGKWVSEAWKQKVLFRFVKTSAFLRDLGPGRTSTSIIKRYGTDDVLGVNKETTIDLAEGRCFTSFEKEWWAANGRHAKSKLHCDAYVGMRGSLHFKEKEPIDDALKEEEKSFLESGSESEERTVEELTINGRRVLLKKVYLPLEFYQSKDYMIDSHIFTTECYDAYWSYTTIIELEEFPEIYFKITPTVNTHFRYDRTDASGEVEQTAEDLYQDYLKLIETANNEIVLEMINIEPEVIYSEPVIGKTVEEKESNNSDSFVIGTKADRDHGETSTAIPEAVAMVIIGGGIALSTAGAGGGNNGGDDDKKKKSKYKMCFKKDFGDAIRYDKQPVTVYARIVEITPEGEEIDRPDLSSSIEMFSEGNLKVESTSMAGNYMGALICAESVKGGQNADSGVLSVRFSGKDASFQNNITFRLIGEPYITFPEQGKHLSMTLPMLLGDGKTYETPVNLCDFFEKPTSVKVNVEDGMPLSCELKEIEDINTDEYKYILNVKNLSPKPEIQSAVKQTYSIGISAENDKEKAENNFIIELYPEGLSIRQAKFDDANHVVIDTFDCEETKEWGDVVPTKFVLDFAISESEDSKKPSVKVFEPSEFSPAFEKLKGTDERTNHLVEKFKYDIKEKESNVKEYLFAPEEALVEEKEKPYHVILPISCTYGEKEYTLDLPVRLLGGGRGPFAGWDEAYADMKKIINIVGGINQDTAVVLRKKGKSLSTKELRLLTHKIQTDSAAYYTKDAEDYQNTAAGFDKLVTYAEILKWFGDQAFSYLISTYYGNTADAILSPAKDVFASLLGEIIVSITNDEPIDLESLETIKNITAGVDNLIVNAFDDKMGAKDIKMKQILLVVAGFLVWKIGKNIYENRDENGNIDLYGAITAITADLTTMGMKKIAGHFFDKALKSEKIQKCLETRVIKWVGSFAPDICKGRWDLGKNGNFDFNIAEFKQVDIIKKYVEEATGFVNVKVVDMVSGGIKEAIDISKWPEVTIHNEYVNEQGVKREYDLSFGLGLKDIEKFFGDMFDKLFENVPFATEVKTPPVDPLYIPVN